MTEPDLDTWKPAALREAEAQLDATMSKARKLIKSTEAKLAQLPETDNTAKPEDIARLKAAAARPDAPAPMRALKQKVDAGELKWEDVLEGRALRDPDVRAAMSPRLGEMREIYQEAEEGATLEEILEARGVTGGVFDSGGAARPQAGQPTTPQQSEEDYYGSGYLTDRSRQSPGGGSGPGPDGTGPSAHGPGGGSSTPPYGTGPGGRSAPYGSGPGGPRAHGPGNQTTGPAGTGRPPQPPVPPAQPPQPHRSAPRVQPPDEVPAEDFFEDPLSPRSAPPRSTPPQDKPQQDKPRRNSAPRRRSEDPPDDDDYFGGPVMR